MKGGGGQQQGQPDQALDLFLIVGLITATVLLLWYYFSEEIVRIIFSIRLVEANALLVVLEFIDRISDFVDPDMVAILELKSAIHYMSTTPANLVSAQDLHFVSTRFGKALSLPSILIGTFGIVYTMFFHRFARYRQVYSMASLSRQEAKNWPQISCVVGKNLVDQDIVIGEWRVSEQPLAFARDNGLLLKEVIHGQTVAKLDKDKARSILCNQMGPLWSGLEGLPPYVLALFAIFCARAEGNAEGARALIRQIAASAGSGNLDFGGTRLLLFKHVRAKSVGRAVSPHAYLYTAMASMLELSRTDGVMAMSEFLWLKPLDRRLWYMLSNVGRRTAFVEVSAPYGHWLVEKRLRRPLKVPQIKQAIEALDKSLSEILINMDDQ